MYRNRLTAADLELEDVDVLAELHADASTLLLVGVLPDGQAEMTSALGALRAAHGDAVRLRIVDEERPLRPDSALSRAAGRVRRRGRASTVERSVVEAVRDAGWTIASIERITPDPDSEVLWVDLEAVELTSGEGDRDQRSE